MKHAPAPTLSGPEALVRALRRKDLAASIVGSGGTRRVHVSPPGAPAAGTDISWTVCDEQLLFFSEWGADIGNQLPAVVQRVLFWFGKAPSPRP